MSLPNNFKELCYILDKKINFNNILIVNTPNTGQFLDNIFLEKKTTRIKYTQDNFDKFIEIITNLNDKFDLICVDPYHEYKESIISFRLLTVLLNDNGILISHDCNPPNLMSTSHKNIKGEWCGVTYAAFIEIAYDNPEWYYAVIYKDYGLGIISKKEIVFVKKITNNEGQKIFLNLFKQNKYEEAYNYFRIHSKTIINLIGLRVFNINTYNYICNKKSRKSFRLFL